MATVDVRTDIVIGRPRSAVAAFASDPDNATAWYANIKSVRWETPPPAAIGSLVEFRARFMGRELNYVYEVTELVPDERFVMRTAEGPFPMETTYTWADTPDGATVMTLISRGEPTGFADIATPLMSIAMRRANAKDLARLKAILEAGSD